ncbi:MAG: tRNA glutamyl-Q(34) synthetase GluQRS [Zetaproteobacteria bacterium CG12_big_fil_rev_8_21_14_0_65_55_1124]|nr:MAG: tRNA glutamyl-Q(34) synthetase GluQRS [Zetaproteobacteria bacterium CG1_02_55_237]PIS18393.1 MAG: tRNA glutamyl-Q(34) synthetase GluQRS [Zetaproteobacteria bacterium CG08_land_8_20_14_0_20_55_17]PIW42145.1 MAG: tRNA glutamyl-Q(34) synthetase GluQRS [Zetaproteobacteria bacterium CG12_big_fil_rev_8_21_14_0_65_55_1124]PIY53243.1 MAG: tRNA glutamyl-Q(34) synthetase GluQRS [Zetaproteobacteria bacterium CG_4_10_14_0_8_um_filter_55_43]PIZ38619.1 MAG: tRNA glutamyl-Q(34) synthetase GluQRS [Zeta
MLRTRFAPSPTGHLHVGNAYSALLCQQWAESHQAELLLRIEDIDFNRCRPDFAADLIEDLEWLGIRWQGDILYQSRYLETYTQALEQLRQDGLIYPCFCTRRDIQREIENAGLAPHAEDMPEVYPGTCRMFSAEQRRQRIADGSPFAWRLDVQAAMQCVGDVSWQDGEGCCHAVHPGLNDAVIGRKDIGISYHLAVVVDDAVQGITHVIRGDDLRSSTGLHRLLQALLGFLTPIYLHHALLCNEAGERLAKRNGAPSLRELRTSGASADTLRRLLLQRGNEAPAPWAGLAG